ncbi:protein kinase domain-containing protein [Corallococcus silvisoli]|uniref:protein kinase domain-containing protein n=1 Tax=Corallococcus silvisoli TaxID=2697031 RepID=UPI002E2A62BB|nr:protein kinase [Corallococcus silvisoli]
MLESNEAELRLALAEGLLSREEVDALREEAARHGASPLELLVKRGRLTPGSLTSLRKELEAGTETPPPASPPFNGERPHDGSRPSLPPDSGEGPHDRAQPATPGAAPSPGEAGPPHDNAPRPATSEDTLPPGGAPPPGGDGPAFPVPHWERYQPLRFLGQGGMGRVFLARDPRLHRDVALKFVRDEDPELSRRFISEARAQARVDHARVCRVYEVGEVQGRAYIAMQYVAGAPLHTLAGALSVEQKALVLRDATLGVHAAHLAGLIHRDLKPSNILVERAEDGALHPYVMDFGLARDWTGGDGATATGTVLGTPQYMAPEQARGEVARLDRRADVYSLGATLYHLLTGQPPVTGANGLELLGRISTQEPRRPRDLDPTLPADLEAIVLKCLEKDRSRRYGSARALADDLTRFLDGGRVLARTGPAYRVRKWVTRHRVAVLVAGVAGLAVAGTVGQGVMARREVSRREALTRRFTEGVERIEAQARYSGQAPLHDTRRDREAMRARMRDIEASMREAGTVAAGPGHYALGRGFLALGDAEAARTHLEAAWATGFHEPRVAYALARVLGRRYQHERLEADRIPDATQRAAKQREAQVHSRDPALDFLKRSQGAELPAPEYAEALRAFHEDRFEEALKALDALGSRLPWFHEAPQLRGDILLARAVRHALASERDAARDDLEAGRRAYDAAANIGRSVSAVHRARAELEQEALLLEVSGQGDVLPAYTRGLEAVERARTAAPDEADTWVLEARLHRRLAQVRVSGGGEVEPLLLRTLDAAKEALRLAPDSVDARHALAMGWWQWARYRQDRNEDAREQLQAAVAGFESIPESARDYDFHLDLGLVFKVWADSEDGRGGDSLPFRAKAIEAYQRALALESKRPDAWINLGTAYVNRANHPKAPSPDRDLEEARTALERASALDPGHVVPWFYLGEVHRTLALRQRDHGGAAGPGLARALECYRQGVAINPRLPPLLNGVGTVLLDQAREAWDRGDAPAPLLDEAERAFTQAIAAAPSVGFAHNNLGEVRMWRATWTLLSGQDPTASATQAQAALQQATALLPGLAQPWANLGQVHQTVAAFALKQGRDPRAALAQATQALERALKLNPSLAQAWRWKAETQALEARGRALHGEAPDDASFEAAARSFQQAVDLEPANLDSRLAYGAFLREWGARKASRAHLQRGLTLTEAVLTARPGWKDANRLRDDLRQALARMPSD